MKLRSIVGEKVNMSQMPDRHGRMAPITLVKVGPNTVIKMLEKKALVSAGFKKHVAKPTRGLLKGIKDISPRYLREIEIGNEKLKPGDSVLVSDVFRKGDLVDVTGTSKGKGFAGGMKRHGFHGGPKTHGQSDRHRAPGSIGSGTTPGRVLKGLRMAGHMGADQVTVQGVEILEIDSDSGVVKLRGAVPGPRGSMLLLNRSIKKKKAYHEPEIPALPQVDEKEETPVTDELTHTPITPEPSPESSNEVTNE